MDVAKLSLTVDSRGLKGANRDLEQLDRKGKRAERSAGAMGAAFGKAAVGIAAFVGSAATVGKVVGTLSDFEGGMAKVAAISGATDKQLQAMRDTAKQFGATTEFTAGQAADALGYLSMAGMSAQESMSALPHTLNLATVGQMDLGRAADYATNVLGGMGLQVNDLERVVDVMAKTSASANTSVTELAQAFVAGAPAARRAGASVEEASAAIGVLANGGIKASQAGTALNAIFGRLISPSEKAQRMLENYGLTTEDISIETHGLVNVLETLRDAEIDTATAIALVEREHLKSFDTLLNGVDTVKELEAANLSASGSAQSMAAIFRDQLGGDLKAFGSAVEGLIIELGDAGLTGALRSGIQTATEFVRAISGMESLGDIAKTIGMVTAGLLAMAFPVTAAAAAIAAGAVYITAHWGELRDRFPGIIGAIEGAAGAVRGTFKAVTDTLSDLGPAAHVAVQAVKAAFSGDWELAWALAKVSVNEFKAWWNEIEFAEISTAALTNVVNAVERLTGLEIADGDQIAAFVDKLGRAASAISAGAGAAFDALSNSVRGFLDEWQNIAPEEGFLDNLTDGFGSLANMASDMRDVAGAIGDLLGHFSGDDHESFGRWVARFEAKKLQALGVALKGFGLGLETAAAGIKALVTSDYSELPNVIDKIAEYFSADIGGMIGLNPDTEELTGRLSAMIDNLPDESYAERISGLVADMAAGAVAASEVLAEVERLQNERTRMDPGGSLVEDQVLNQILATLALIPGATDEARAAIDELNSSVQNMQESGGVQSFTDAAQAQADAYLAQLDRMRAAVEEQAQLDPAAGALAATEAAAQSLAETATGVENVQAKVNDVAAEMDTIAAKAEAAKANFEGLSQAAQPAVEAVRVALVDIAIDLDVWADAMVTKGKSGIDGFASGIQSGQGAAKAAATAVAGAVSTAFNGLSAEMRTLGVQAMAGFSEGIKSQAAEAAKQAAAAAGAVRDSIKRELDIQSPSRVTREIGQQTGEGLILGVEDMLAQVNAAGLNMGDALGQGIQKGVQGGLGQVFDTILSGFRQGDLSNIGQDLLGVAQDSFVNSVKSWLGGGSFFPQAAGAIVPTLPGTSAPMTSLRPMARGQAQGGGGFLGLGSLFGGGGGSGASSGGFLSGLGGIGGAISKALPIIGGISMLVNFFKTTTKVIDTGVRLTVDGMNTILEEYERVEKSKFFGLSKSRSTSYDRIGGRAAAQISRAVDEVRDGVTDMAEAIGLSAEGLEDFYYRVKVSTANGGDAASALESQLESVADAMSKVILEGAGSVETMEWVTKPIDIGTWMKMRADEMLEATGSVVGRDAEGGEHGYSTDAGGVRKKYFVPTGEIKSFEAVTRPLIEVLGIMKEYETHGEALERLSSSLTAVNAAFNMLGHDLYEVSIFGADAASNLVDAFGDLETATAAFDTYYQKFYSAQEQFDGLVRQTTDSFAALGMALPESRAQFRAMVEAIDLSTIGGRELYAEMLSLAGALDAVLPTVTAFTDQIALLIGGATSTIGTMISEAGLMAREAGRAASEWERAADRLRDFIGDLVNASTSLASPEERFMANQRAFADLMSAARGGDADAARDIPSAARDLLTSAQAVASTAAEYRFLEGRVRAQVNMIAGLSEIEQASETYTQQLYLQQIDVLTALSDYLNTEGVTEEGIGEFTAALSGIQAAIEAVEMINFDFLQQRLTVAVDLLADADIPEHMRALLASAETGIRSTLTFAVLEEGLTPDMRWLALQTASEHIKTIEFLGDNQDLPIDLQEIALAPSSTLRRTIEALRGGEWDADTIRLALAGNSELTRVVNATLASDISLDAMRLALRGLNEMLVTVEAVLSPGISQEVRTLALQSAGTYAVAVDATLAADLPAGVRDALLGQQALMAIVIHGAVSSDLPSNIQALLISASTSAVRAVTISAVYADDLNPSEIALLDGYATRIMRTVVGATDLSGVDWQGVELLEAQASRFVRLVRGRQAIENLNWKGDEFLRGRDDWFIRTVRGRQFVGDMSWRGLQLLDANARDVLRRVVATVNDSALTQQQRNFLDMLTAEQSGNVTLGGTFSFDPTAAFTTALEAGFSTSVSELETQLSEIGRLLTEQTSLTSGLMEDQLAFMRTREARAHLSSMDFDAGATHTLADGTVLQGAFRASFGDLASLARTLGVDMTGRTLNQIRLAVEDAAQAANILDPDQMIWLSEGSARAQEVIDAWDQYISLIPGFAHGGMHGGGLRIVGEDGPELEATGPARYYSASQTAAMMGGRSDDAALLMELRAMRSEQRQLALRIEKNTHDVAKLSRKWDIDGLPEERTA